MPMRDFLLKYSLCSFSESLEEYYFPVLIHCGKEAKAFVQEYSEELAGRYVVIDYEDLIKSKGEKRYDEDR
jgi:hypothetical protein